MRLIKSRPIIQLSIINLLYPDSNPDSNPYPNASRYPYPLLKLYSFTDEDNIMLSI